MSETLGGKPLSIGVNVTQGNQTSFNGGMENFGRVQSPDITRPVKTPEISMPSQGPWATGPESASNIRKEVKEKGIHGTLEWLASNKPLGIKDEQEKKPTHDENNVIDFSSKKAEKDAKKISSLDNKSDKTSGEQTTEAEPNTIVEELMERIKKLEEELRRVTQALKETQKKLNESNDSNIQLQGNIDKVTRLQEEQIKTGEQREAIIFDLVRIQKLKQAA